MKCREESEFDSFFVKMIDDECLCNEDKLFVLYKIYDATKSDLEKRKMLKIKLENIFQASLDNYQDVKFHIQEISRCACVSYDINVCNCLQCKTCVIDCFKNEMYGIVLREFKEVLTDE